jgi:hypothetical protein
MFAIIPVRAAAPPLWIGVRTEIGRIEVIFSGNAD